MKKFIAVLAVLALTMISSVAMAEVTVSGSVDIRSLALNNTDTLSNGAGQTNPWGTPVPNADRNRTTQERIRINIDGKNEGVKGRVTFENDWEVWATQTNSTSGSLLGGIPAGVEARPGQASSAGVPTNKFGFREAWIDFTIPGAGPAHVKVGHQFLQLGNGWFFRSNKFGSDAWLVGRPGQTTFAFVDVKGHEGSTSTHDDVDAFVLLANHKIDDTKTAGIFVSSVQDRQGKLFTNAFNNAYTAATLTTVTTNVGPWGDRPAFSEGTQNTLGLWFNGKVGPVNLQAELDLQMGDLTSASTSTIPAGPKSKFKGMGLVVQANMPIDAASVNAAIGYGSGDDPNSDSNDIKSFIPLLDADPHYTFVYEYFAKTACLGLKNTGFCNTTAFNIGGSYNITKNIMVAVDLWMLKATEKVSLNGADLSNKLGNEIDLRVNFKLNDNLTWNWQLGRLMAGDAYKNPQDKVDDIDAVQGILSYKF